MPSQSDDADGSSLATGLPRPTRDDVSQALGVLLLAAVGVGLVAASLPIVLGSARPSGLLLGWTLLLGGGATLVVGLKLGLPFWD